MSPVEIAAVVRARLAAEIRQDLAVVKNLSDDVTRLRGREPGEREEWMRSLALAFELERFYTAVETTLIRILRTLDGDVPGGGAWHQEVLRAASVEVRELRPAIIDAALAAELRELLGFRHAARHGYDRDVEASRLDPHAARVVAMTDGLCRALDDFASTLE